MTATLNIQGIEGNPIIARLVRKGDTYGLRGCMVHDEKQPLVEFYDARYVGTTFGIHGQFISRYYCYTVMQINDQRGILLDTGAPEWRIDWNNVQKVQHWLLNQF